MDVLRATIYDCDKPFPFLGSSISLGIRVPAAGRLICRLTAVPSNVNHVKKTVPRVAT